MKKCTTTFSWPKDVYHNYKLCRTLFDPFAVIHIGESKEEWLKYWHRFPDELEQIEDFDGTAEYRSKDCVKADKKRRSFLKGLTCTIYDDPERDAKRKMAIEFILEQDVCWFLDNHRKVMSDIICEMDGKQKKFKLKPHYSEYNELAHQELETFIAESKKAPSTNLEGISPHKLVSRNAVISYYSNLA